MALDLLARREHSEQELAQKLSTRGVDAGVVSTTIAALVTEGLLSNARYTGSFIYSRFQRGQGPQKIRAELRGRGIDAGMIDACLFDYDSRWQELLEQVRLKKFGPVRPDTPRERNRQMRFLLQRGFTAAQIAAALRRCD
jgi:regulatory protein